MHHVTDADSSAANIGSLTARRDLSCQGPEFDVRRSRSFQEPLPVGILPCTIATSTAYTYKKLILLRFIWEIDSLQNAWSPLLKLVFIRSVCQHLKQVKKKSDMCSKIIRCFIWLKQSEFVLKRTWTSTAYI